MAPLDCLAPPRAAGLSHASPPGHRSSVVDHHREIGLKILGDALRPLVETPPLDGTIREKLEAFAAAEGLQL